jgi:hypothetical protein
MGRRFWFAVWIFQGARSCTLKIGSIRMLGSFVSVVASAKEWKRQHQYGVDCEGERSPSPGRGEGGKNTKGEVKWVKTQLRAKRQAKRTRVHRIVLRKGGVAIQFTACHQRAVM